MIKLDPITLTKNLKDALNVKISNFAAELAPYSHDGYQKRLELCQIGKLLVFYFPHFEIEELTEQPDFIITDGVSRIGLEHQIIINQSIKNKIGFFESIFHRVEKELQSDNSLPNFLANCFLDSNYPKLTLKKDELIRIVKDTILTYVKTNQLPENRVIRKIISMPHTSKHVSPNFGAYMVNNISAEVIIQQIEKKEKKVNSYIKNTNLNQWLVLIVGTLGEYSYEIQDNLEIAPINSKFDKIFLFSDFDNKLYQLK